MNITLTIILRTSLTYIALSLILLVAGCVPTNTTSDSNSAPSVELLEQATFGDGDGNYSGSGSLKIMQEGNRRTLHLEDFEVSEGPNLIVILVENVNESARGKGEYTSLGDLESESGDQKYRIPADVDLATYSGVMIYCDTFNAVFSRAEF